MYKFQFEENLEQGENNKRPISESDPPERGHSLFSGDPGQSIEDVCVASPLSHRQTETGQDQDPKQEETGGTRRRPARTRRKKDRLETNT